MADTRPNVLFIMTDQQAPEMLSCTGTDWVQTPALDRLASEGVRFERAYCTNPVCVPSRTSMATGIMSRRLGAADNETGLSTTIPTDVEENSLGMLMKRAGYDTYYGGKVHMCAQLDPARGAGYDRYFADERDELPDDCIAFMTQRRDQPFFAVASFINPHDICFVYDAKVRRGPRLSHVDALFEQASELDDDSLPPLPTNFDVPDDEPEGVCGAPNTVGIQPHSTMSRTYSERDWRIHRWVYARLMESVDAQIGAVLTALEQAGLDENTVIIFTSDHGEMAGSHRLGSKNVFYDESVRVPFIMKQKGVIDEGTVDDETLVSSGLDLLPTCCDYAGVEPPPSLLGASLRPVAEAGREQALPRGRQYVVAENTVGRMIRSDRWKYCAYEVGVIRGESLVDLEDDPGEMINLAAHPEHDETLRAHREMLQEWSELSDDLAPFR